MKRSIEAFLLPLWLAVCLSIGSITSCGGSGYMPEPASVQRNDLFFGYYLTFGNQVQETKDHVNLIHESGWFGADQTIASMRSHGKATMLSLSSECYASPTQPQPNVEERVTGTLLRLQQAGVLSQVVALYPIDEPDLHGLNDAQVTEVNAAVRKAAAKFPELANVKLAVIYTNKNLLPGFASYDWIGMDAYEMGADVLVSAQWKATLARLQPEQRLILVPGGGDPWRQNPEAFRRYAHRTPQVVLLMPFMWATRHDDPNVPDMPGIGTNGMAPTYRAVGLEITSPQPVLQP